MGPAYPLTKGLAISKTGIIVESNKPLYCRGGAIGANDP